MIPLERIGRYRLGGEIGRGAMGAVYRARDPQLQRDVAVKLISLAYATGHGDPQEAAARFAREARVAARVQHPNVVAVYDFGEEADQLYLVMELVEGETLSQRLARGDFPGTTAALDLVAQTADALAAAHRAGVIHRDIKPANLLLPAAGPVKVSDFGVAKAVGESTELTRTGMMVGSPAYMAPEQVQGQELDGRSDLFSLGVVLYELLMHRKPFPADTLTTLVFQILHQDPFESETVAGRLHPDLIDLLRWALAKERDVRIPDAVTFAARARALAAQFARTAATAATAVGAESAGGVPARTFASAPAAAAPPLPPFPLPPASYATSAPTEIVHHRHAAGGGFQRWLPWVGARPSRRPLVRQRLGRRRRRRARSPGSASNRNRRPWRRSRRRRWRSPRHPRNRLRSPLRRSRKPLRLRRPSRRRRSQRSFSAVEEPSSGSIRRRFWSPSTANSWARRTTGTARVAARPTTSPAPATTWSSCRCRASAPSG